MKLGHELRLADPAIVVGVETFVCFHHQDLVGSTVIRQVGKNKELELSFGQSPVAITVGVVPSPPIPHLLSTLLAIPDSMGVYLQQFSFDGYMYCI